MRRPRKDSAVSDQEVSTVQALSEIMADLTRVGRAHGHVRALRQVGDLLSDDALADSATSISEYRRVIAQRLFTLQFDTPLPSEASK